MATKAQLEMKNTQLSEELEKALNKATPSEKTESATGASLAAIMEPVIATFDNLDAFTQSRMTQDLGRSILGAIGWNRAFMENVLYGNYATAHALQGGDKDDTGVFIGAYATQELTPEGKPIESLIDQLSEAQQLLLSDLENKEDLLWDAFDSVTRAYKDLQGAESVVFLRPSQNQRHEGIKSIEDMVEAQKRFAIQWNLEKEQKQAAETAARSSGVTKASASHRAKRRSRYTTEIK